MLMYVYVNMYIYIYIIMYVVLYLAPDFMVQLLRKGLESFRPPHPCLQSALAVPGQAPRAEIDSSTL